MWSLKGDERKSQVVSKKCKAKWTNNTIKMTFTNPDNKWHATENVRNSPNKK